MEYRDTIRTECIGIGCFWFAAKTVEKASVEDFSCSKFLEEVKKALETIDSVSDVKIFGPGDFVSFVPFAEQLSDDYNFFPMFTGIEIAFNLFMPCRLQEEYALGGVDVDAEQFRVLINYGFEMPVAYISYKLQDDAETDDQFPSTAVMFIREYLETKLKDVSYVNFQSLGPSPFHADFIVSDFRENAKESEANRNSIQDISERMAGYKRFVVSVDADGIDVVKAFVGKYNQIFEAFYYLTGYRVALLRSGISGADGANALFAPHEGVRFFSKLRGRLRQGTLIDDVYQTMLENKRDRIMSDRALLEKKRDGTFDNAGPLMSFFEGFSDDETATPWDDIRDLLKLIEERRQKYFSNLITLIAGLAGGLIGAIIGASMTFALSKNAVRITTTQTLSSAVSQPQESATFMARPPPTP